MTRPKYLLNCPLCKGTGAGRKRCRKCGRRGAYLPKNATLEQRFWAKVQKGPGCWEWIGARNHQDYGRLFIPNNKQRKCLLVNRFSWELHNGPIPKGMTVLHICDNPPCVKPKHLRLGTHKENMQDMVRKGRCKPSKLLPSQVIEIKKRFRSGATKEALSKEYHVSTMSIYRVVTGRTWKALAKLSRTAER